MKISKYNMFIKTEDNFLIYNTLSSSIALISDEEYKQIEKKSLKIGPFSNTKFENDLLKGNFFINDDVDELMIIKDSMYKSRYNNNILELTIAITSDCNFRCSYCFQSERLKDNPMTLNTQNNIIEFIISQKTKINALHITWYGGEPLLEIEKIEKMSKSIIQICQDNYIDYSSNIITNGFLLTESLFSKLQKINIKNIQITIDGMKDTHNNNRYLKNKDGTFNTIIKNITDLKKYYDLEDNNTPSISIRINVSNKNKNDVTQLINYSRKLNFNDFVYFYISPIKYIDKNDTISNTEFYELNRNIIKLQKDSNRKPSLLNLIPKKINSSCVCDRTNSFVIDPNGDIYKCWEKVGLESFSIGNIANFNTKTYLNSDYYYEILFDPTTIEECSNCVILPICMGGTCPINRGHIHCDSKIDNVKENIYLFYKILIDNKD